MDYCDIRVPFISKEEIKKAADEFRDRYCGELLPVDIEKIIDGKLKIQIIPIPNLRRDCDMDAHISFNWQTLYVDADMYKDDRQQNRLRFSFAHEIGHYILHKDIYSAFKLNNIYKLYELVEQIPAEQYGYLETQANKFAGYLLVPREKLEIEKKKLIDQLKQNPEFIKISDDKSQNSYLAIPLAPIFGVSQEAMEIVLSESH
ncbi:MAG: ImmA/IrrE family metallo-endopeptidase [Patescibacteria group bacterium]|nr:ImmA/IrrE family metallo-endopeptidase [Patescibacteria group bacterium]MDD5164786.1 ImmA/IrrE family metallo-endopeptidase [Patescibacteria group bacterium]MDD5534792.1 ImmA/IrrE family metallo-endopeptidase [Patescibacteria group bacterium]